MKYILTNKGLDTLKKTGLKKILDSSFPDLEHHMLHGFLYEDEIKEYANENKIPNLLEKVEAANLSNRTDSFIMHSEIICNLLKKKLPKNIEKEIKNAISAYYLYYDEFLKRLTYSGTYLWRDEDSLNIISGDTHGDMRIEQYDISQKSKPNLFNQDVLVKKTDLKLVDGYYSEWLRTLTDFITFCIQIKKPVPFKENWEKEFYKGFFEETEPGSVANSLIKEIKRAKENKEYSYVNVLPFTDNPKKHMDPKKSVYHIQPVISSGGYSFYPFIDKEELIYLSPSEKGVEFLNETWGNPGVRFNYEQIPNAIKGVVSCIQNHGSRCLPQDPGLVFKYFPYERLENHFGT